MSLSQILEKILDKHSAVFTIETGSVNGIKANLIMKEGAQPVFVKARSLAYALKPKVEKELERLESENNITKVPKSKWATPIVPIRLEEYNLRANKSKCQFFQDQIEYCGHLIDKQGLHKTKDKIKAVLDTPEQTNQVSV
ncbi:uncharacterized protein LOC133195362 [Saccostrea echinata]|uniref:uncharacterized protein LOC133195362 n=1 Tax=Saccostrea echinata TaxID=191078 RepID=UPI002A7EA844|nr:uncharacterized protein LOC133195362 [Saccostrea echinata]